jgi:microcystin-dependent protein
VTLGVPIGTIIMWPSDEIPEGWLLCDGKEYPILRYAALYGVIKRKYGYYSVNNSSYRMFRVPDFRGMFPIGAGMPDNRYLNTSNQIANNQMGLNFELGQNDPNIGEYRHVLSTDELANHKHNKGTFQATGSFQVMSNHADP